VGGQGLMSPETGEEMAVTPSASYIPMPAAMAPDEVPLAPVFPAYFDLGPRAKICPTCGVPTGGRVVSKGKGKSLACIEKHAQG